MKRSILSALVLIIVGLVLSGCGVAATQYKVENQKFDSTYPFNKYSIQVYGNKGLMFGYNIVTYLPYSEKNLEKLKKVLAELKNNNKINGVECRDSSNTSVLYFPDVVSIKNTANKVVDLCSLPNNSESLNEFIFETL